MAKYLATVNGESRTCGSMGSVMRIVMRSIEARGGDPVRSLPEKPNGRGRAWRSWDGVLSGSEVRNRLEMEHPKDEQISRRWFCADGELFHPAGRTIALTREWTWDKSFRPAIAHLNAVLPDFEVEVDRLRAA